MTLSTNLSMNQFKQKPAKGMVDAIVNPNTLPCMVDPDSTDTLYHGDAVKIVGTAGNTILVDLAAATDPIFGYVEYSLKKSSFEAGDAIEIGCDGTILILEAGEAIERGKWVEWYPTGNSVLESNGVNPISGLTLDPASANHDLIRVMVKGLQAPVLGAEAVLGAKVVALTAAASVALNCAAGSVFTLTPDQTTTITATNLVKGQEVRLIVTTSGSQYYILTLSTGLKATGTLNTGGTNGKVFALSFVSDGSQLIETSRTTAM